MRKIFINELIKAAKTNNKIILIVGDLGFSVVEPFADKYPQQFINAGVSEQNMMGLAAGLASEGNHVFVYSIANFPTFRCAEQVKNDIDYHKLSVTIVSVGAGVGYGNLGYSHHAIQDYAFMRSLPNMLIASPGDGMELKACMKYLINFPQTSYLRLDKETDKENIEGELWSVHSGGFYNINKLKEPPKKFPKELHWFKWEAYTTWISGFVLLVLVYYLNAEGLMIDKNVNDQLIKVRTAFELSGSLISAVHTLLGQKDAKYKRLLPPLSLLSRKKEEELMIKLKELNFISENIAA